MKTFKYKIAGFTPDNVFLWSQEHTIKGFELQDARETLVMIWNDKGYILDVDYKIIYLELVDAD